MITPPSRRRKPRFSTGRRRRATARRTVVVALGLAFAAIGVARADTTVIGTALQSSSQASTMSQSASNIASPLPVVGPNHSRTMQDGSTTVSNSQGIPLGEGGLIDGRAIQGSTQGAATTQVDAGAKTQTNGATGILSNDQLIGGGGIILGDTGQTSAQGNDVSQALAGSKVATADAESILGNTQVVGDEDGLIVGTTAQGSQQADDIAQSIGQKASNPTIGNSTLSAAETTVSSLTNGQGVGAGTIIGSATQASDQAHNGVQTTKQTPAPVITGGYLPSADSTNVVGASNCQAVGDGSVACLMIP